MITHNILSLSCLLAFLACIKLPAVAFVFGRSHAFQQGVALNHLFATTSPLSQSEKDIYGTYTEIPTTYEDASSMIKVALLTYAYATVRECARIKNRPNVVYKNKELILNDKPVTSQDIYGFIRDNIELLKKEKEFLGKDGVFPFEQLQALLQLDKSDDLKDNSEVIVFDDKDPRQLCYGITLNKVQKRIVVSFRGTNGIHDVWDDIRVAGVNAKNPLYKATPNQKEIMQIHNGFYSALFKDKEDNMVKFDVIMNSLIKIKKQYPNFQVYVTGHSLGGALATVFAFYASTSKYWDNFSPFPVTCVSVASPIVGDYNWRCAFMLQEKLGKIRHLRISNYCDIVPKVPCFGVDFPPFSYKHTGVHLQLYDNKPPRFSYPKNGSTPAKDTMENVVTPMTISQILHYHLCELYVKRTDKAMDALGGKFWKDLYEDEAFVGEYKNV